MPASFLHGIEVIEVPNGPVPVTVVKSAVIGLVGTAPEWAVASQPGIPAPNQPTLVSSAIDAAKFGPLTRGYTIPYALAAIQGQGAGQVIVVNVFDPAVHFTSIGATAFTFNTQGVINLGHMGVSNVVVTSSPAGTTYSEGTDYTVDAINGIIKMVASESGGSIAPGATVLVSFRYADPSKVTDSDVIGSVTGGVYSGLQALQTTYGTLGFFAKILIAPRFSQSADVATPMSTLADKIRAMALIDSPASTSVAAAIANRNDSQNAFGSSSKRAMLCFPQETFFDAGIVPTGVTLDSSGAPVIAKLNANAVGPYSQWVAGGMAARDLAKGYWWSPSNTPVAGILGPDIQLYASILDPASDVNSLNAAGIVTVFNAFATGLRVWGNRSAAYPSAAAADNFISVRRTMDVIEESVELAMLEFIDQPISNALIDAILASVNAFIRSLIQRGALAAGAASFDPAENPPAQIAAGQLTFDIDVMPPPPAERITFKAFIDVTLLEHLGQTSPITVDAGVL
ncbi:MAG: phage tail sheath subtilisin-like domain-containing protein [Candidatus Binatus sp.]|uniref:phage tail sheath family protein n=1 Tax=Candidatus Binatus sp. TaxID=2811406 RepID=UPI00271D9F70|nr:phage tail sheath subtilisin-like domain-containing protein [Candidatus Binatus sp.]MDO8433513.1 phage tail sheath subtilisin-like domain-containing protein [Candidatus Binatus sp.]